MNGEAVLKRRSLWTTVLLSFVLPGLGQLYNRNVRLAWVLLPMSIFLPLPAKWLVAATPPDRGFAVMNLVVGTAILVLVFALVQSAWQARRQGAIELAWFNRWYVYLGLMLAGFVVTSLLELLPFSSIRSYSIPSSMLPTLVVGDRLEAKTEAFHDRLPMRGEVVLYELANDPSVTFVHRVIGLPGDRVQWRAGRLYLNGEMVERRQVEDFVVPNRPNAPLLQYEEILPDGRSYRVIESSGDVGISDETEMFDVPSGRLFVAGDNRDGSMDSRNGRGFVPFTALRDQPLFLYWSSDLGRIGKTIE